MNESKQLLDKALALVESESIRKWAQSEHNMPIWLEICENSIGNHKADPRLLAIYIVTEAMGL